MEKAIHLAAKLGIRIIQISGYDVYYEESTKETKKWFGENLRRSVDVAACYGVMLAFENMETPFMNTIEKAMHWVGKINSPYLCLYPDTGNLINGSNCDPLKAAEDLKKGLGSIAAFHLKEAKKGVFREVPYGTGCVPFQDFIHLAYQAGVRRYLAEFWYAGNTDWVKELQDASKFLRGYLNQQQNTCLT